MALLWSKYTRQGVYEVRHAGNTVRLYTDNIFHSQWNALNPICGQLWELLFLPVFFNPQPRSVKRILILGVGGGAVINLCNRFLEPACIVGVELDQTHIAIAKRWFGVKDRNTRLIHCDAIEWVETFKGKKFDLVVEDLFVSNGKAEPVRAVQADSDWLTSLAGLLNTKGVLVMNFESLAQARLARRQNKRASKLCHAKVFSSSKYENAITAFSSHALDMSVFRKNLSSIKELDRSRRTCKLAFSCQKI